MAKFNDTPANCAAKFTVQKPDGVKITTMIRHRAVTVEVDPTLIDWMEQNKTKEILEDIKRYQQEIQCINWYVAVQLYEDWCTRVWDAWFDSLS